jgi:hypothetical protein
MITRILTSRFSKTLLALFILSAALSQAVPYVVDTKPYIDRIAAQIKDTAGATLMIKGGSHFQVIPRPALILKTVEILQPDVKNSPSLTADIAEIAIDVPSLLTGTPRAKAVRVAGVSVVAERQGDADAQWGFLSLALLKKIASTKPGGDVQYEIFGGNVSVADTKIGKSFGITDVSLSGVFGEHSTLNGSIKMGGRSLQFSALRDGVIGATPIALSVNTQNGSTLSLKGSMDFTADYPLITGKLESNIADIAFFTVPAPAMDTQVEESKALREPVPLKLSGDYVQKEGVIVLSNISLEALKSKATGALEWGGKNRHKLALNFSTLDVDGVKKLFALFMLPKVQAGESEMSKTLIDRGFDMELDMSADEITNGEQKWSHAIFNGTLADGVLTVNQMNLSLPGDSRVSLFGLLSVNDTQGMRFEGNTELQGSSLRELLTVFDESASNLPALGFGAYKLRSNLFISKELLRLSEADANFSELSLKGGLVAYFDKRPRIEAEIGLRDIDFDYFRNSWRASSAHSDDDTVFLRFDKNMNFDWLKKLSATIDFKVNVQGFNFLERKGDIATFRLFAQSGEFGIYNAKFNYDQDTTEANLKFDVSGVQPSLGLVLNASVLNTNYFALRPEASVRLAEPVATETAKELEEALPEMSMPDATPEEELLQKIQEEADELGLDIGVPPAVVVPEVPAAAPDKSTEQLPDEALPVDQPDGQVDSAVPIIDAEKPSLVDESDAGALLDDESEQPVAPVELTPLTGIPDDRDTVITTIPQSLIVSDAQAQVATADPVPANVPPGDANGNGRWSEAPIDMSLIEGINGNFDISIGKLQHKDLLFQNFKMLAKLERNLLTFQTLTFIHWGGSFSINGTIFGGKVPGLSLGFIIASADIQEMLGKVMDIESIGGRASVSGVVDTSGVNMLSWVQQANAKMLFAGRGVSIQGLDVASVLPAVNASRTAADVFNNVNLSLVGGAGEYSADGAVNLQKGVFSTPGIALKTGRIVGNITGDFRLIPWDINLSGAFKFPELATENVPTLNVQWSGPVEKTALQTDTQSLEAFVSKRIIGN